MGLALAAASVVVAVSTAAAATSSPISFAHPKFFPGGRGPSSVAAADLNGDGHLDLVTANSDSNDLTVLLGNGSGGGGPPLHTRQRAFSSGRIGRPERRREARRGNGELRRE